MTTTTTALPRRTSPKGFETRETQLVATWLYDDADLLRRAAAAVYPHNGKNAGHALRLLVEEVLLGEHLPAPTETFVRAALVCTRWTELALYIKADGGLHR